MAFSQQALNLMNGLVLGPISFDQVHHIQKSISWRTINAEVQYDCLLPIIAQYIATPLGQKAFVGGILSRIRASALATRSMI